MSSGLVRVGTAADRERATDAMMKFLDALSETFPECDRCRKAAAKFRDQALRIEMMEDLACLQWLTSLATPLPASVAPYVYPLSRLLGGRAPVLYHAVAYKDGDTLVRFGDIPLISNLELDKKWHHPEFVENRLVMLAYIERITKCVLRYAVIDDLKGVCCPDSAAVPPREAIEAEIARFALEQSAALPALDCGVNSGFVATIQALVAMFDMHGGDSDAAVPMTDAQLGTEWQLLMDNPGFADLCGRRDEAALRLLETTAIPSFGRATEAYGIMPADARSDLWEQLNNLVSFSILTNAMPPAMRSKVEEVAAMLTGQINSDSMSLDDLTPQKMLEIGQFILSSTSDGDLAHIQSHMSTLLPAVKAMSQNNKYMQGLDKETGGILSRLL
jgi:hypothetical protein